MARPGLLSKNFRSRTGCRRKSLVRISRVGGGGQNWILNSILPQQISKFFAPVIFSRMKRSGVTWYWYANFSSMKEEHIMMAIEHFNLRLVAIPAEMTVRPVCLNHSGMWEC